MAKIENYMDDGANWQAQCVLAYLRDRRESILDKGFDTRTGYYQADIYVGRYENFREQGYVFSVRSAKEQKQINFVVYQYRCSDEIVLRIFDKYTLNTPTFDEVANSAYKEKVYECCEVIKCAQYIEYKMIEFIDENLEEKLENLD